MKFRLMFLMRHFFKVKNSECIIFSHIFSWRFATVFCTTKYTKFFFFSFQRLASSFSGSFCSTLVICSWFPLLLLTVVVAVVAVCCDGTFSIF